jgi:hypothetical protein
MASLASLANRRDTARAVRWDVRAVGNKLAGGPVGMVDNLSDIGSTMRLTESLPREQT